MPAAPGRETRTTHSSAAGDIGDGRQSAGHLCEAFDARGTQLGNQQDAVRGPIIVNATITVAVAILIETALSYLGFGIKFPSTSLGLLISDGQAAASTRPWLFYFPGLVIILIALTINFVGDGLRDALDPQQNRVRA